MRGTALIVVVVVVLLGITAGAYLWRNRGAEGGDTTPDSELLLSHDERLYLATIEHRALLLGKKGYGSLACAMDAGDADRVAALFTAGFQGHLIDLGPTEQLVDGQITWRSARADAGPVPTRPVDGAEMAAFLVGLRTGFGDGAKVKFSGRGLKPARRYVYDGAWEGRAKLEIKGPSADGGVRHTKLELALEFATIPDVEAIEAATGWIAGIRVLEGHDTHAPAALMADVAAERGIDVDRIHDNWEHPGEEPHSFTGGAFVEDLDGDGFVDLLISDVNGVFLYRNRGDGTFEDRSAGSGLKTLDPDAESDGEVMGDFDGDGLVDVILGADAYRNTNGFRFEAVPEYSKMLLDSFGANVADYDRDGRLDVYVPRTGEGDDFEGASWFDGPGGPGHSLYRNLGDWQFEDVAQQVGATCGQRSSDTAAWLFENDDDQPDLYVASEFGPGVLLLSQPDGRYADVRLIADDGDFATMGLAVGDYDNDGHRDIYANNMYSKAGSRIFENLPPGVFSDEVMALMWRFVEGSELYHNEGNSRFARVGGAMHVRDVGWTHGAAFVDLDNDTFLDLYSTAGYISISRDDPTGEAASGRLSCHNLSIVESRSTPPGSWTTGWGSGGWPIHGPSRRPTTSAAMSATGCSSTSAARTSATSRC